jgi:hypothetical protein
MKRIFFIPLNASINWINYKTIIQIPSQTYLIKIWTNGYGEKQPKEEVWFSLCDIPVRAITSLCISLVTHSTMVKIRTFNDAYNKRSLLGGVVQSRHSGWRAGRKVRSLQAARNHAPPGSTRPPARPISGMNGFNFFS